MNEASLLLRSVLLNPADNLPRLVLADWLEEHDEPDRAALIRRQCRGEKVVIRSRQARRWFRPWWNNGPVQMSFGRTGILIRPRHGATGTPPNSPLFLVTRGFVSRIELPLNAFLEHAAELFHSHPITSVRLTDRLPAGPPRTNPHPTAPEGRPVWWAACPWFETFPMSPAFPDRLPHWLTPELCRSMAGLEGPTPGKGSRWYTTPAAAQADLAAACVKYGRALAGLPPIAVAEPPTPPREGPR